MVDGDMVIKKSRISGHGVVANRDIKTGETIYFLTGESCTLNEVIKRVKEGCEAPSDSLQIDDDEYLDLDEMSRTFNHSCEPNSYMRGLSELIALRDIRSEEEITCDYSTTMNDDAAKILNAGLALWTCACHCGSNCCRGIIDQFTTLPEETRMFYLSNKVMPDFMLEKFTLGGA